MVLDRDDRTRERAQRLDVERLDRVEIDHPRLDPVLRERVGRLERLVHGDPRPDDRDVVTLADRPRAADLELLVRSVDDRRVGTQRAEVDDPLGVGHPLDELRGLVRVARMQHGRTVHGA